MEIEKLKFINITGNIGSGATTLCQKLCERFKWQASYSQAHASPYLKEFYQKGNFAFQNQVYIIMQSIKQHLQLDVKATNITICQDYTIYEHNRVYSRNMFNLGEITSDELTLLDEMFDILSKPYEKKPDLLIYLTCSDTDVLLQRILKRGRSAEKNINKNYIDRLQKHFDEFTKSWRISPVIEIDTAKFDVFSPDEISALERKIRKI